MYKTGFFVFEIMENSALMSVNIGNISALPFSGATYTVLLI